MTTPVGLVFPFDFETTIFTTSVYSEKFATKGELFLTDCIYKGIDITVLSDKVTMTHEGKRGEYYQCKYIDRDGEEKTGFVPAQSITIAA